MSKIVEFEQLPSGDYQRVVYNEAVDENGELVRREVARFHVGPEIQVQERGGQLVPVRYTGEVVEEFTGKIGDVTFTKGEADKLPAIQVPSLNDRMLAIMERLELKLDALLLRGK